MGGLFSPSAPSAPPPQQVIQQVEEPMIEQRDVEEIDRLRRRQQRPSLLQLLGEGSDSPTIL